MRKYHFNALYMHGKQEDDSLFVVRFNVLNDPLDVSCRANHTAITREGKTIIVWSAYASNAKCLFITH